MSEYPIELTDLSGKTRFKGTGKPTPGGSTPDLATVLAAGHDAGGVHITNPAPLYTEPPAALEICAGGADVLIADGAFDSLPWGAPSGDVLLDLTNPAAPSVLATGVYAVVAVVGPDADLTIGGFWEARLRLGNLDVLGTSPPATAAQRRPSIPLGGSILLNMGQGMLVRVFNRDGVAARNFAAFTIAVTKIK